MTSIVWIEQKTPRVARTMTSLGLLGFWMQLVFLITVVVLGGFVFRVASGEFGLRNVWPFLGLALPVFTTMWCRHYGSLGRTLAETRNEPTAQSVLRKVWLGVWAGAIGSVVNLVSLFGAASTLLITMLANPQVGLQISPADTGTSPYSISAIDAVSIVSLLLTLTAELLVVVISLRLVFLISSSTKTGD